MTVREALSRVAQIQVPAGSPPAAGSAAAVIAAQTGAAIDEVDALDPAPEAGIFQLEAPAHASRQGALAATRIDLRLRPDGSGRLASAGGRLLYAAARQLVDVLADDDLGALEQGLSITPSFAWNRSCYDVFLTQEGRIQHGLDVEAYVRQLAAWGYTHVEVNALAYPMGLETGPKGEVYPMFYTYCPALDQFVYSSLNKGLYPFYYLSANLAVLKRNAALARKYGLVPGLLSFEPRSVPEEFFARYPMLRGPRVDHPFRSFRPRFTMTLAHPRVRDHYAEMMTALLREVPDLGFLSVWSNDSGSGFEHTKSLYVGRNGGPYMIREWKDDAEIAKTAGAHVVQFLALLRNAARAVNPEFRVLTRLESFYGEHDTVWAGLGNGLDVETTSLIARGWEMPYHHPRYPDSNVINSGSVYQLEFAPRERELGTELRAKDAAAHHYFSAGPHQMFAPLLGIPYPTLTWRRLKLLRDNGVDAIANVGGTCPPGLVPFNVNHEILRRFQFDAGMDIDAAVSALAERWAGTAFAPLLRKAWALAEEAILAFPNTTTLYSTIGFTWYRLWVRPFVPNIEAIPRAERAYYEDFMCTTLAQPEQCGPQPRRALHPAHAREERQGPRTHRRWRVDAARSGHRSAGVERCRRGRATGFAERDRGPVRAPAGAALLDHDASQRVGVGRRRLRLDGRGQRIRAGALAGGARRHDRPGDRQQPRSDGPRRYRGRVHGHHRPGRVAAHARPQSEGPPRPPHRAHAAARHGRSVHRPRLHGADGRAQLDP